MFDEEKDGSGRIWSYMIVAIFAFAGYVVYGGWIGALAVVLFYVLCAQTAHVNWFMPVSGVGVQGLLIVFVIWPIVSSFSGIEASTVTAAAGWAAIIHGCLVSANAVHYQYKISNVEKLGGDNQASL